VAGQQNSLIAERKEFRCGLLRGDTDAIGPLTKGALIQAVQFPKAPRQAGSHGRGPKRTGGAELQALLAGGSVKTVRVPIGSSGEKEQFLEIAVAEQLGFGGWQTGVLGKLARRKGTGGNDRHAGFLRNGFESFRGSRVSLGDGNAGKAAETNGLCGANVEIAFGKVNAAGSFRDKGMGMTEAANGGVELEAVAAGDPNEGNTFLFQGGREFIEAGGGSAAGRNQGVQGEVENSRGLAQTRLRGSPLV
jgi:hypothetical protein